MFSSIAFPSQLPLASRRRLTIRAAVSEADKKILYEVLRVKRNASQVEIKTAYRTLAKLYHPDAKSRFMDSEVAKSTDGRDFIEIHQAYATLSDPDARAQYDSNLSLIVPPQQQRRWNEESGLRSPGGAGSSPRSPGSPTRRWETDQCW